MVYNLNQMPDENSKENAGMTRRDFLKLGAAGAVGLLFGPRILDWLSKEKEPTASSHVIMVDFAPEEPSDNLDQAEYPKNEKLAQKLLGNKFRTKEQIEDEFNSWGIMDGEEGFKKVLQKHPEMAIFYAYMKIFGNHGEMVAKAMKSAWQKLGQTKKPFVEPLQEIISPEDILFTTDEYGNYGAKINLKPERIIAGVKKTNPNGGKVINLSLQVGEMEFWKSPLDELRSHAPFLRRIEDGIGNGSSSSTGLISALTDFLVEKSITPEKIRETIITQYCHEETSVDQQGKTEKTFVIDPEKFKE